MEIRDAHTKTEPGAGEALSLSRTLTRADGVRSLAHQEYANITVQDAGRLHAGNHIVNQHNYYAPTAAQAASHSTEISLQTALAFPEMNLRSANIAREQSKSCEWLFDTFEYKRWRNPAYRPVHHGILWIRGKPGAGKSTLIKYALRKHQEDSKRRGKLISFFFNARGKQELERSTEGMYRALLHQVLGDVPQLHDMVDPHERENYSKHGWPLELLKDMTREAVSCYSSKKSLTCYIDALDECDEDEIRDMLSLLEELGEEAMPGNTGFAVCLTSRHYPNIRVNHVQELVLDNVQGHENDISVYVQRKLNSHNLENALDLTNEIRERSSGVFLWVVLVVAILNKARDQGNVHQLRGQLLAIPTNLRELFDNILDRDGSNDNLMSMIQWTLYAARRLTAIEMYFGVLTSAHQSVNKSGAWDKSLVNTRVLQDFILTSSKGFLELGKRQMDSSLEELHYEFIHESVREYFIDHGLRRLKPSLSDDKFVATSHEYLAQSMAHYIPQLSSVLILDNESPTCDIQWSLDVPQSYPLLNYVKDYGALYHAEEAERLTLPQDKFCAEYPLADWLLIHVMSPNHDHQLSDFALQLTENNATLLHLLVDRQFENLVQREFKRHEIRDIASSGHRTDKAYLNAQCGSLGTALHIAIERGNIELVKLLLSHGINLDAECTRRGTALHFAVMCGNSEITRFLLLAGATIDFQCIELGTPLHVAVVGGDATIVRALLDHGANTNARRNSPEHGLSNGTVLHLAVTCHDETIVRILVKSGADIHAHCDITLRVKDLVLTTSGATALHIATASGNWTIARILLASGTRIDAQHDREGMTALHIAVYKNSPDFARLLLDHGADIRVRSHGETAIELAVRRSEHDCLRYLLKKGIDGEILGSQDIGHLLVMAAKTAISTDATLSVIAECKIISYVQPTYFLNALKAIVEREVKIFGCVPWSLDWLLIFSPREMFLSTGYDELLQSKILDGDENKPARNRLWLARDERTATYSSVRLRLARDERTAIYSSVHLLSE